MMESHLPAALGVWTSLSPATGSSPSLSFLVLFCCSVVFTSAMHSGRGAADLGDQLVYPVGVDGNPRPSSRLSDLLAMKHTVSLMKSRPLVRQGETYSMHTGYENSAPGIEKRVFCNIYSGCGGDKRRRQLLRRRRLNRQKKSVHEKRPFCNTYGCYNGRKRAAEDDQMPAMPFGRIVRDVRLIDFPRIIDRDRPSTDSVKRVFCNPHHGCQSYIKRPSALPILIGTASGLTPKQTLQYLEQLQRDTDFHQEKRFFAGGFDNAMEDFVGDLKR